MQQIQAQVTVYSWGKVKEGKTRQELVKLTLPGLCPWVWSVCPSLTAGYCRRVWTARTSVDFIKALALGGCTREQCLGWTFLEGVSGGCAVKGRWTVRRCCLHSKEKKSLWALAFFSFFFSSRNPCLVVATATSSQSLPRCMEHFGVQAEHFYTFKCYWVCEPTV